MEMERILILAIFLRTSSSTLCPAFCKCYDKEIFCSDNGFTSVPQVHGSDSSAKHLSLAGNSITTVEPQAFLHYPNLTSLDLRFNSICSINHRLFTSLSGLTELHLGYNNISSLESQTFKGLSSLLSLDLHENQLCVIKMGAFDGLFNLKTLRLSGNALTMLHQVLFLGLRSLETLYMENNQIKSMSKNTFKGLGHLHELNLSGNNLSCFPDSVFKPLSSLSDLLLGDNFIMHIKNTHFKSQVGLKELSLSNNMLSEIDPHTFNKLSKLEVLKLNGNHILKIETHAFSHCTHIREIELSDNLISTIEDSAFVGLTHLRVLRLNRNKLSHLSPRAFGSGSQLSYLNMNENPWDCDCRILCLKRWLESGANRLLHVFVRCSQPETLRGQYLVAIRSALIQSTDRMCSHALPHVNSQTILFANGTWLSQQNIVNSEDKQTHRGEDMTAPEVIIKNAHKRDTSESQQYQNQSGVRILPTRYIASVLKPAQTTTPTKGPFTKDITVNDACLYNQVVIIKVSARTVTSSSAVIEWSLAKTDSQNVYFRVMYDQFRVSASFSRFVNVKQGTVCNLGELRPSTAYFVCVESVVHERVCHVASRDLCLGIITKAEETSGPEPQTIILYFSAANTLALITILVLFGYTAVVLRQHWSNAFGLMFSQNRSISCAMCAGIPMSDHTSGIQTSSSQTGTYQPNDVDAIDLPPAH